MTPWLLGWVAGVAAQLQQAALWPAGAYHGGLVLAVLTGLVAAWSGRRHPDRWGVPRAGAWLLCGALAGAGWAGARAVAQAADGLSPALEGAVLEVTGRVASLPQRGEDGFQRFEFAAESGRLDGQVVHLPSRLLLGWYPPRRPGTQAPPVVRPGERWRLPVRLKRAHGVLNPHGFDRERWLWENGLGASGTVATGRQWPVPQRLGSTAWHAIDAARQAVGERIAARVPDARQAGVLAALVVGDQSAIGRADWELFRITGVAHLMSISGLHVTMFVWLAVHLVGGGWRRAGRRWPVALMVLPLPRASALGGIALATAYALFAGWGVPAQRTLLMLAVVMGLRLQGRHWPWPVTWLAAMAVVLLLDPLALMQPGFWLSFVAVGILFAADPGRAMAQGTASPLWRRAMTAMRRQLAEQAVITLALAPLTLLLFAQVSLVGLLANLLAVPWVTVLVTPLAFLGVLWSPVWTVAAWAVHGMTQVLALMAAWPWAVFERPMAPWSLAAVAVAGGVLLVQRWPWVLRSAGLLLVWPVLWWAPPRPPAGEFEVMAIDVGQGSAILVRTGHHSLLFDTGPGQGEDRNAGERIIVPLLRVLGERLDAVVISHGDSDHAGGMPAIAAAQPQARWLAPFAEEPERRCVAGQHWVWDGVRFDILNPWPQDYGPRGEALLDDNAMSCVLRITHAGGRESAWLTGDIDAEGEVRLAMGRPGDRASLWVAPHHGSKTSSTPAWLNVLQPRHIIIQAGYRNHFGHPSPTVLARYRQRGIPWVVSPDCGMAIWRSEAPDAVRCWRDEDRRYWRWHPAGADDEGPPTASASALSREMP